MLQTFPKHQAGWSGTGVNVPALFYRTVTAEHRTDTQTLKIKLFSHFIFLPQSSFLSLH